MLMLTFLFLINTIGLIAYYLIDLSADNHIDMATPLALIILVMLYFILFIIIKRPYNLFIKKPKPLKNSQNFKILFFFNSSSPKGFTFFLIF